MTEAFEARLTELKGRVKRCCCKYCGSPLELRHISYSPVDAARIEIFCSHCDRIEFGVEKEIYQAAKYYVDELEFNAYPSLDDNSKTREMNVAQVSDIIAWGYKNLGHLTKSGFTVPVTADFALIGEQLILAEDEWPVPTDGGVTS